MKFLIVCAGDRSKHYVALNALRLLSKNKNDEIKVCVFDKNKKIIDFCKKKKISYLIKNLNSFFNSIKKNEYDWLLNIWGNVIHKKKFLNKFKKNLNFHPSFLPYNRGRDPYYFAVVDQTPIGICIHEMDSTIDGGKYYVRKKILFNFPFKAEDIFDQSLKLIKNEFLKNWSMIKKNRIKLKKFPEKIRKINRRKSLIKNNFIDLDNSKNYKERKFVLNILGQDFSFLKMQLKIFCKIYNCKLELKRSKKKIW